MSSDRLSFASLQKRGGAFVVDEVIVSVIFLAVVWDILPRQADFVEISMVMNRFVIYLVTIKIAYHTFFVWKYGATLGKQLFKIAVVDANGKEGVRLSQSFNRAVFRVVSEMAFYLGFLLAFVDPKRQAFHDKTASTLVVDV